MDADGGNQTRLTDGDDPVWSPDGTMIAFESGQEVYAINADGSGRTKLTDSARVDSGGAVYAFNGYPAWSPIIQLADCTAGWSRLTAGRQARVSDETADPNRVRSGPSREAEVIALLDPGTAVKLLEGPVCADGLVFWKVQADPIPGGAGWIAEGDAHEYWLEPDEP
jgi:hypothetical protein